MADFGFLGEVSAHLDGDGYSSLLEYALGTRDDTAGDAASRVNVVTAPILVGEESETYLVITHTRNLFAQNTVSLVPQLSYDLRNWNGGATLVFLSETDNRDGSATVSYRSADPIGRKVRAYIRLIATR